MCVRVSRARVRPSHLWPTEHARLCSERSMVELHDDRPVILARRNDDRQRSDAPVCTSVDPSASACGKARRTNTCTRVMSRKDMAPGRREAQQHADATRGLSDGGRADRDSEDQSARPPRRSRAREWRSARLRRVHSSVGGSRGQLRPQRERARILRARRREASLAHFPLPTAQRARRTASRACAVRIAWFRTCHSAGGARSKIRIDAAKCASTCRAGGGWPTPFMACA